MARNVFPTKNNLMATKRSLELASVGYDLMDSKRSILIREVMRYIDDAKEIQRLIDEKYAEAYRALMIATVRMGDCMNSAYDVPTDNSLEIKTRSVMGVELPELSVAENNLRMWYSPVTTDASLDEAYRLFNEVKLLTVKLAQTEAGVMRLADAIKRTAKRTNALGSVMIPELESTAKFISTALEEKEREDFTRLKVIKNIKE